MLGELAVVGASLESRQDAPVVGAIGAVVEQRPLDQWFLKMEELVKPALKAVLETEEIKTLS